SLRSRARGRRGPRRARSGEHPRALQRAPRRGVRGEPAACHHALPVRAGARPAGVADRNGHGVSAIARARSGRRDADLDRRGAHSGRGGPARRLVERGSRVMSAGRVAVIQFPGVNCEAESVRALERVGLETEVFRWTRDADELARFDAYLLPGGWSYQDRVRAGALAAKDPLVEVLAAEADQGKPVIGICNGAQVLVEAGLVPDPDGAVGLALARN